MMLKGLKPGQQGKVTSVGATGPMKRQIMDMGVTPGVEIKVIKVVPLGNPVKMNARGYELNLRREEVAQIQVET